MQHIILIILIIFIFCFSGFVSAQEIKGPARPDWFDKIYQGIDQKIIRPVKQSTQNLPEEIEKGVKHILERVREEKQEKQEEIKQEVKKEIKKETKKWGQKAAERIKGLLAPLKNKIQQGTGLIRQSVNKIKYFLIDFLKE